MGGPSETTPTTCQRMAPYDTTTPISSLPGDGDGDAAPVSSSDGPMIHKRVTRSSSAVSTEVRKDPLLLVVEYCCCVVQCCMSC